MATVTCKIKVPKGVTTGDINTAIHNIGYGLVSCKFPPKSTISAKGSQWEREFATKLSLWVSNQDNAYIFERRSGSGGSKRDKLGHSGAGGDIVAIDPMGKNVTDSILFELKYYRDLAPDLWTLLTVQSNNQILDWWRKLVKEANEVNKYSCLVMRINQKRPIVLTNATKIFSPLRGTLCNIRIDKENAFLFPLDNWLYGTLGVTIDTIAHYLVPKVQVSLIKKPRFRRVKNG